jgi:hypothetical protein
MSPGSYSLVGRTRDAVFVPQFSNPIVLGASNFYGADFYAGVSNSIGHTISGQVFDGGTGVQGVEVRAGGVLYVTDAQGNYQFTNFPAATYIVAPARVGWSFSPVSTAVSLGSANSAGNNFTRFAPYSISGAFTNIPAASSSPVPKVFLSNGKSVLAVRSGSGANRFWTYNLAAVPAGQYSLSATVSGNILSPNGFTNPLTVTDNVSGKNFIGSAGAFAGAISGRITRGSLPVAGIQIQAAQNSITFANVMSDSEGYYRIENVPAGAYSLSPSGGGFSFSPSLRNIASVPALNADFAVAGQAPPVINTLTASPTVVSNPAASTTLSVTATGASPLSYSWDAVIATGPVPFSNNDSTAASNVVAAFQSAGNYTFRVRVTDGNGLSATATVGVTVSPGQGSLAVSPYQVQVAGGQTVHFRADAWDGNGNPVASAVSWSASGGGTMDTNGNFAATTVGGPFLVTATSASLSARASVTVVPNPAAASAPIQAQLSVSNAAVTISWSAVPGSVYRVEYKPRLSDTNWLSFGPDVTATNFVAQVSEPVSADQRFYHIAFVR